MSLIQEALRRRDGEEVPRDDKPTRVRLPAQPPVVPPYRERRHRVWTVLVALLVVILLLVGAALGLLFVVAKSIPGVGEKLPFVSRQGAPPPVREQPAETPPEEVFIPVPEVTPADLEPEPVEAAPLPPAFATEPDSEPAWPEPGETAEPVVTPVPEERPMAVLPPPREVDERPAVVAPVETTDDGLYWPRLKVGGVLRKADPSASAAIINGELVGVNERIMNVLLIKVETGGVWLKYHDEQRFIRVGRSTR